MLIRITYINKSLDERKVIENKCVSKPSEEYVMVSYTDRDQQFRVLCGSA